VLTGHGRQTSPSERHWPPPVQEVSNGSPPLSPADALKTFYLPPGYSIGSTFTLGPPGIPARILLNGKDGAVGLMPPVGSALSDEQIASVLTYVRREWGQAAAPVDAGMVKTVRELSAGRRRPWTDDELMKLAGERRQ